MASHPFSSLVCDGAALHADTRARGRRLRVDRRCLDGEPVLGAWAHVCALTDPEAAIRYDEPEVQAARRDALGWWIPLLGDSLVCLTTIALDASRFGGAITVMRDPGPSESDPFARIFQGTLVRTDLFSEVPPPPGPVIERYAGAPWPAGRF